MLFESDFWGHNPADVSNTYFIFKWFSLMDMECNKFLTRTHRHLRKQNCGVWRVLKCFVV